MSNDHRVQSCEEFEEQIIKAAFSELLSEDYEALQSQELTDEEQTLLSLEEKHRAERLRHIERSVKKHRAKQRTDSLASRFLRAAAALVVVAAIGAGTAFAFDESFRNRILELLSFKGPEYTQFGPYDGCISQVVPDGWMGKYYPTYLPEGYQLDSYCSFPKLSFATFTNSKKENLVFQISTHDLSTQVNTENAISNIISVGGFDAYLYSLEDAQIIIWSENSTYFSVSAPAIELAYEFINSLLLLE